MVKWVETRGLHTTDMNVGLGKPLFTPVIPLSALREVVEGVTLALDYYRAYGTNKYNPYEVEQRLERLLAQLAEIPTQDAGAEEA